MLEKYLLNQYVHIHVNFKQLKEHIISIKSGKDFSLTIFQVAAPQKFQKEEKVPVILEVTDQMLAATWQSAYAGEIQAVGVLICEIYQIYISLFSSTGQTQMTIKKIPKETN